MKHKDKLKLARRMMTPQEIKAHVSPFQSKAWEAKKEATRKRVAKKEAEAKARSEARKKKLRGGEAQ